jgi:hypothetical protein
MIKNMKTFPGYAKVRRKIVVTVDTCTRANSSRDGDAKLPVLEKDSGVATEILMVEASLP